MNNKISMKTQKGYFGRKVVQKVIVIFFLMILFINCIKIFKPTSLDDLNLMTFRKIAYNSLSEQDKKTVSDDWQEAEVGMGTWYRNKKGVTVTFWEFDDGISDPIIIAIDPFTNKVLGIFPRL